VISLPAPLISSLLRRKSNTGRIITSPRPRSRARQGAPQSLNSRNSMTCVPKFMGGAAPVTVIRGEATKILSDSSRH